MPADSAFKGKFAVFAVAGADATTRVVFAPAFKSKNRVPFDNFRAESLTR